MQLPIKKLAAGGRCFGEGSPEQITINPIGMTELSMLSEAATLNKHVTFVDAILNTVENVEDHQLSMGEFFQIVAYHRINAFPDSPIELNWTCSGFMFTDKEENELRYDEVEAEDTEYQKTLRPKPCGQTCHVDFEYNDLDILQMPERELPEGFAIPTAALYAEYVELSNDPKLAKIIPAAQWIAHGTTIEDKIKFLRKQTDLKLFDQASRLNHELRHGPLNKLHAACPKCGTQVEQGIVFDQYSFFRQ